MIFNNHKNSKLYHQIMFYPHYVSTNFIYKINYQGLDFVTYNDVTDSCNQFIKITTAPFRSRKFI